MIAMLLQCTTPPLFILRSVFPSFILPQQNLMIFLLWKFPISYMNIEHKRGACTIIHAAKLWWKTLYGRVLAVPLGIFHYHIFYSLSCSTLVSLTSCMVTPHHTTPHVRLLVIYVLASHNEMVCTICKLFQAHTHIHVLVKEREGKRPSAKHV